MAIRLVSSDPGFEAGFAALLATKREVSAEVDEVVRAIIARVRTEGDAALVDLSRRFDRVDLVAVGLEVTRDDIATAYRQADKKTIEALAFARDRIEAHHIRQRPSDDRYSDPIGVELGSRWTAIEAVGLYVPGGTANYPSSVLMNAVPAKVAGVERIVITVPASGGEINPLVLVAADLAGVSEIYQVGGAQAIAALAHGTETIRPVAKIVGPGNAYVAAAKRQVFGTVGIDMVAGPSEVLVLADRDNDPAWIAADLLAQAEHDAASQSILVTDDVGFANAVERAVEAQLALLPRADTAAASWRDFGAVVLVRDFDEAVPLVNRVAGLIRNAGAMFFGKFTPEVIGDYVGGSNHVLPTARSARFSSGLGVLDFMKRTSILKCSPDSLRALAPAAIALGEAEGLHGHARSVAIRLNPK